MLVYVNTDPDRYYVLDLTPPKLLAMIVYRFPVCKWQPQSYDHIMAYQKDASTPQSVSVCEAERDHIKNNCVSIFKMSKDFIQEHGKSNFLFEKGINHHSRSG